MLIYLSGADDFEKSAQLFTGENAENLGDTVVIVLDHQDFSSTNTMNAIKDIVETTGVDKEEVYLGGYSLGAQKAMKVANENPDYYAGVIAISGWSEINPNNFKNTAFYATAGTTEGEYGQKLKEYSDEINAIGGNAQYEDYIDTKTGNDHTGNSHTPGFLNRASTWDWINEEDKTGKVDKEAQTEQQQKEVESTFKKKAGESEKKAANEYIEKLDIENGTSLQ